MTLPSPHHHTNRCQRNAAPGPGAAPIVWAVFLGANTNRRLADQWVIPIHTAKSALRRAAKSGDLVVAGSAPCLGGGRPVLVYGVRSLPPPQEKESSP